MLLWTGGALSQAKGAFSNWWSNLLVSPDPIQKGIDVINETDEGVSDSSVNAMDNSRQGECDENGVEAGNSNEERQSGEVHTV